MKTTITNLQELQERDMIEHMREVFPQAAEDYQHNMIYKTETIDCCPAFNIQGAHIDYRKGIDCINRERYGQSFQLHGKVSRFRTKRKITRPHNPVTKEEYELTFIDFSEPLETEDIQQVAPPMEDYPIEQGDLWILGLGFTDVPDEEPTQSVDFLD